MPDIVALKSDTHATLITFPQCALGATSQKYTSLLVSAGLSPSLQSLANLRCQHSTHADQVGGSKTEHGWTSRQHSAYPPDLNFLFARVIASYLRIDGTAPQAQPQIESPPKETTRVPPTETAQSGSQPTTSLQTPAPDVSTTSPVDTSPEPRNTNQPFK
eukprot:1447860-Pleurochrysis_carterae.AAC.1